MYYKNAQEFLRIKKLQNIPISVDFIYVVEKEINKIIIVYNKKELYNKINSIINFIIYEINDDISWLDRLYIIQNQLKNDSSSMHSFEIRYGKENAMRLFKEKNNKTKGTIDKYTSKYGEIGEDMWKNKYGMNGQSIDKYVKKYGLIEGNVKYQEYIKKRNCTYQNNKILGKKYDNGRSLEKYINRHGEEEGLKKYLERNRKQSYRFSLKYYIDNYGDIDGIEKWNEYKLKMNKTSLNSFVLKHGEELGKIKYDEFVDKIKYANSLEFYLEKYGDIDGVEKWNDYRNKTIFKKSLYSKISQDLFWMIYENLDNNMKNICNFGELNSEWFIKDGNNIYFFDFVIKKLVIEFDGEYWHSLKQTQKNDKLKENLLKKFNYKLLRINERDYLNDKMKTLNHCLNFIKENYE